MTSVWEPDDGYRHGSLSKAEQRWLQGRRRQADQEEQQRRARSESRQMHRACEQFTAEAGKAAARICTIDVANPPPAPSTLGQRPTSGPSDPALAQVESTHNFLDVATTRLGHLLDDCPICDHRQPGPGHNHSDITLALLIGNTVQVARPGGGSRTLYLDELADHLTGISTTSPQAIEKATADASAAASAGQRRAEDLWRAARNAGAEEDDLREMVGRMVELASRARRLADSLSQYGDPGLRRCACGCGAHAPTGRRYTEACRKRLERQSA